MLKIRLSRTGKKKNPSYRVVVADSKFKRDGRFVEQIGFYDPMTDPITYKVREDRALYWLSVGAQPSDAVRRLLVKQGTTDRLVRLHAGEEFGALIAEFEGTPWPPIVEEEEAAEVVEEAAEVVKEAAEAVAEVADDVVEAVAEDAPAEVVEEAVEEAAEVVEEVADEAEVVAEAVVEEAADEAGDE